MTPGARRWLAAALSGLSLQAAEAQEDAGAAPDLEFLEYLGTWQETDEEWLAVENWDGEADRGGRPQDDASTDEATADNGSDR